MWNVLFRNRQNLSFIFAMILQIKDQTFPVPAIPYLKLEPGHLLLGLPEQQLLGLPLLPQCLLRLSLTLRLLVTIYCLKGKSQTQFTTVISMRMMKRGGLTSSRSEGGQQLRWATPDYRHGGKVAAQASAALRTAFSSRTSHTAAHITFKPCARQNFLESMTASPAE